MTSQDRQIKELCRKIVDTSNRICDVGQKMNNTHLNSRFFKYGTPESKIDDKIFDVTINIRNITLEFKSYEYIFEGRTG